MLKTLRLHNFRTFLNAEFNFTQRHLLIGANNSGKTNLCTALSFLRMTASSDLAVSAQLAIPGGVAEIKNWAFDSDTVELSCICEMPFNGRPHVFTYDLALRVERSATPSQEGQLALRVAHERLIVDGPGLSNVMLLSNDGREARTFDEGAYIHSGKTSEIKTLAPLEGTMLSKLYEWRANRLALSFQRYLSSWLYFTVSPQAMRHGWSRPARLGALETQGDNLASVLYHMKNMDERRYRRVVEHVRLVEPDLEAINFIPAPDQAVLPFITLRNCPRASWHGLSDGTLRFFALAVVTESAGGDFPFGPPAAPPVVIIEEPENGIFPGRLRKFFDLFEERAPDGQFLFTSHSPYFINLFDGYRDSVTLLRRAKEITEVVRVPPAEADPDRELLAEQHSMELFD